MAKRVCDTEAFVAAWGASSSLIEVATRCGYRTENYHSICTIVCDRARRLRKKGYDLRRYRKPAPDPEVRRRNRREWEVGYRSDLIAAGLCPGCKGEPEQDKIKCRDCAAIDSRIHRDRRVRIRSSARRHCSRCLRPRNSHSGYRFNLCSKCLSAARRLRKSYRDQPMRTKRDHVLSALQKLSLPTVYELASDAGVTTRTVLRHVKLLAKEGLLERLECDDRMTRYRLRRTA